MPTPKIPKKPSKGFHQIQIINLIERKCSLMFLHVSFATPKK